MTMAHSDDDLSQNEYDAISYQNNDPKALLNDNEDNIDAAFGIDFPWSPSWCFSVVGCEYCHTYFWIAKDLAWTQGWRITSISFGILALVWWIVIAFHAMRTRSIDEIWNSIALFLWLFANFWWMSGEAHDHQYPEEDPISPSHTIDSAYILEAALLWLAFYYLILIPFHLIPPNPKAEAEYDDGSMHPRFSYFRDYRQYENVHMLFWLAKDLAWNQENISMWFVFVFPTVLVAADLIRISFQAKNTTVDNAHYLAVLLWVFGNIVWAIGEFFFENYDDPIRMWHISRESFKTARWYSSWLLFSAYVPIALLYAVWIPLTLQGRFKHISRQQHIQDNKYDQQQPQYPAYVINKNDSLYYSDVISVTPSQRKHKNIHHNNNQHHDNKHSPQLQQYTRSDDLQSVQSTTDSDEMELDDNEESGLLQH